MARDLFEEAGIVPAKKSKGARDLFAEAGIAPSGPNPATEFGGLPFRPFGFDTGMTMPEGLSNFVAGGGKSIVDTGRGLAQVGNIVADTVNPRRGNLTSLVTGQKQKTRLAESEQALAESRARDAPLMDTSAGFWGNLAGSVGQVIAPGGILKGAAMGARAIPALASAAPALSATGGLLLAPKTIGQALTVGGALGAIQPAESWTERGINTGIGSVATAAVPSIATALRSGRATVEPLYEAGQQRIIGRALNRAAGADAPAAVRRMSQASELVPGSMPTVGQVAQSPGLAALERAAGAIDPQAYGQRAVDQNFARAAAVREIAGTETEKSMMEGVRGLMSDSLYAQAKASKVPLTISDRKVSELMSRPSLAQAWAKAETMAREAGVQSVTSKGEMTGETLHYLKMALDQQISEAPPGSPQLRLLMGTKNDLLKWMDKNLPKYGEARAAFASWSKPINAMEIGSELSKKLEPALMTGSAAPTRQNAEAFARALRDGNATAAKATEFRGATLENTLAPGQLNALRNVGADLGRSAYAKDAGRGVGSDTIQKLSQANVLEQAGIPNFLRNFAPTGILGNVLSRGADVVYNPANQKMSQMLAQAMLDPRQAALMMQLATPSQRKALMALAARQGLTPLGMAAPSISSALQLNVGQE